MKPEGKNFVDLARTARRDDFTLNTCDVRIRNVKSAIPRAKSAQRRRVDELDEQLNLSHQEIKIKHEKLESFVETKIHRKNVTCDFGKNLSRDYQNNLFNKNIPIFGFSRPNVKYTKPSTYYI